MLTYRYTQTSTPVVASGAALTVESFLTWRADDTNNRETEIHVCVTGEQSERGRTWSEAWIFAWPGSDLALFEKALRAINEHVDNRQTRDDRKKEVYVDVYDWLRVGWIDEAGKWRAYLRFKKDAGEMVAEFPDFAALVQFRHALFRAKNF